MPLDDRSESAEQSEPEPEYSFPKTRLSRSILTKRPIQKLTRPLIPKTVAPAAVPIPKRPLNPIIAAVITP
jgi:hypothetical protein